MCDTCVDCEQIAGDTPAAKLGTLARDAVLADDTKRKRFYRLSLVLFDVPVIVLGLLGLITGVAIAIGLFFGLRNKEQRTLLTALDSNAQLTEARFASYLAGVQKDELNLAALISLRGINITRREFDLYTASSHNAAIVVWLPLLTPANRNQITSFVNSQYANTSVTFQPYKQVTAADGKRTNQPIDGAYKETIVAAAYFQPLNTLTTPGIGFDIASNPARNASLQNTLRTGLMSATSRIILAVDDPKTGHYSSTFYQVVRDEQGQSLGVIGAYFRVEEIISGAVQVPVDITMFDASDNYNYLYTTNAEWRTANPSVDSKDIKAERALFDSMVEMEQQGIIPQRINITVGDRTWVAFVSSNPTFVAAIQLDQQSKWVALALGLFFGIVALVASWCIVIAKRLLYSSTVNSLMAHKIDDLKAQRDKMDSLIERLAQEEQRVRSIVNIVPMSILIVSGSGNIAYANEQFLQAYQYPASGVQARNMPVSQVLPHLDVSALTGEGKLVNGQSLLQQDRIIFRTSTRTKLGVEKTSRVCISNHSAFNGARGRGAAKYRKGQRTFARNTLHDSMALDNCFVVILFDGHYDSMSDLSNRSGSKSTRPRHQEMSEASQDSSMQDDVIETKAFYKMLYDHDDPTARSMLAEFRSFCAKNHSTEALTFFDMVEKYRKTERFMNRIELQQEIVESFLEKDSPHQLNLPHEKLASSIRNHKLHDYIGIPDIFDEVLEHVLLDLRLDLFNRFHKQKLAKMQQVAADAAAAVTTPVSPVTPVSDTSGMDLLVDPVTQDTELVEL